MKKKNPIVKKSKKYIPIRFIQKRKKFSSFFFSFTSVNLIWFIYLFIFGWSDDEGGRKVGISLNVCETKQTNMCACIHIKVSFLLSLLLFYLFFFLFFSRLLNLRFSSEACSHFITVILRIWIAADYYFLWKEILSTVDSFREQWIPVVQVLYYLLFYLDVRLP